MIDAARTLPDGSRQLGPMLAFAVAGLLLLGLLRAEDVEQLAGFAAIVLSGVMPAALWIARGMPGIPILPTVASLYVVYYGFPVIRGFADDSGYDRVQVLNASLTVAGFLSFATVTWFMMLPRRARQYPRIAQLGDREVVCLVQAGIGLGLVYNVALASGILTPLGTLVGAVRAMAMTPAYLACFLLGYARAKALIRGRRWYSALAGLAAIVLMSLSSLYMVSAVTLVVGAFIGYIITGGARDHVRGCDGFPGR
jgi:hypothetical protein